jgi:tetratricopeptide (TPR) repeat protein/transcriptional regulator with XRE-family HTH domain
VAELADELRRLKDRAGLSLAQLATRTWYSKSSLERYINGKVFPPRRVVEAISDACGGDTDALVASWERAWTTQRRQPGKETEPGPMELPADLPDFTGRKVYRAALEAQLTEDAPTAPPVAVICGMAGTGKTALAVHVAHRVAGHYPDGQLYLHLAGMSARPVQPREALGQLLRSLGVDGAGIPDSTEERAALYRSRLAGRHLLVVLDDAATADQVRPLIPGTAASGVIVTSRARLAALAGARLHQLEPFRDDEAIELLSAVVGEQRIAENRHVAASVVSSCGNLPLAIRIAGSRLSSGLRSDLAELAARLADENLRLGELTIGDVAVRSSLELSYRTLTDREIDGLNRFAELDFTHATTWLLAALADLDWLAAERLGEDLVAANLLMDTGQDRRIMHDLVRHYAREQARHDPPAERSAALDRVLGAWLDHTELAERALNYRFFPARRDGAKRWRPTQSREEPPADPMLWYTTNRRALLHAVRLAGDTGRLDIASGLATLLTSFFAAHSDWSAWRASHEAVRAANPADPYILRGLGELEFGLDRSPEALRHLTEARAGLDALGDHESVAYVDVLVGMTQRKLGDLEEAARHFDTAAGYFDEAGDLRGRAQISFQLGVQCTHQGRFGEAAAHLHRALDGFRDTGETRDIAYASYWLGVVSRESGQVSEAYRWLGEAERTFTALSDRGSAAICQRELADLLRDEGKLDEATGLLVKALGTARELGEPAAEMTSLHGLGTVLARTDPERGIAVLTRALDMARALGRRLAERRISDTLDAIRAKGVVRQSGG